MARFCLSYPRTFCEVGYAADDGSIAGPPLPVTVAPHALSA
jgi:hypothetical protein